MDTLEQANTALDDATYEAEAAGQREYLDSTESGLESAPAPVAESANPIRLSVITSNRQLSTSFTLSPDKGELQKECGGEMVRGTATNYTIDDLGRLWDLINTLNPNQALTVILLMAVSLRLRYRFRYCGSPTNLAVRAMRLSCGYRAWWNKCSPSSKIKHLTFA